MIDAERLDLIETEHADFAAAMAEITGEFHAAIDWVDDAFGEIEHGRTLPTMLGVISEYFHRFFGGAKGFCQTSGSA